VAVRQQPERVDTYPLSPMQRGMLFHWLYGEETDVYVNQLRMNLSGLDVERFAAAWQQLVERHDVLRTRFLRPEGRSEPAQVVERRVPFVLREMDLRGADSSQSALDALSNEERAKRFDLERPPAFRIRLVQIAADRYHLIWTYHHVLMDGWSQARLMQELLQCYAGRPLAPLLGKYRDYVEWLGRQDRAAAERFWRESTSQLLEPTLLGAVFPAQQAAEGFRRLRTELGVEQTRELLGFARRERVTLNTVVQAAWLLLLQRHTRQRTVAVGVTVAGRPASLPGGETLLGLFINTLPLVQSLRPEQPVGDWLRQLQQHNLALREYEYSPLYDVQRWAGRPGQALFDSIIVFDNYPAEEVVKASRPEGVHIDTVQVTGSTNYPLALEVSTGERLRVEYGYATNRFSDAQIQDISAHLSQVLRGLSGSPQRALGALSLLTDTERGLLRAWNATDVERDPLERIDSLFEAQVRDNPERVALTFQGSSVSYAELDRRAARLACRLRAAGVGPDVLVGLHMQRSPELVLGMLAILKAGGAYVPLDPEYPEERLALMIEDSRVALVLTDPGRAERSRDSGVRFWCVDGDDPQPTDATAPAPLAHPDNLAYCIYTSGSTGKPKGVGVSHRNAVNFLRSMAREPGVSADDRVLAITSLSFDISVLELLLPLVQGSMIVLLPREAAKDPAQLWHAVEIQAVSVVQATPSTWQLLCDQPRPAQSSRIKALCGGEALLPGLAARLLAQCGQVWNVYGPTETTVWSSIRALRADDDAVSMGSPIANTSIYLLDDSSNAAPLGAAAELYIGGSGVARGYHGRPGLTAERFIPDALGSEPGQRLYRTGDLARHRADGSLEYLGRADHQVKIRGHRIEPGEIESRLLEHDAVREAVVVARDTPAGKRLASYVVLPPGARLTPAELRQWLRAVLPEYMVPAHVTLLDALPRTPNGKLDRKALPAPDRTLQAQYIEPRTPLEHALAGIWGEVLNLAQVGVDQNFFDLGGDSIISLQVVARGREAGLRFTPKDIFEQQTIQALASVARAEQGSPACEPMREAPQLSPAQTELLARLGLGAEAVEDVYPLSPMQQGMLFHAADDPSAYVNQLSVSVEGLDAQRLRAAWQRILERHAGLRTAFLADPKGGGFVQLVHRSVTLPWRELDLRQQPHPERALTQLAQEQRLHFDLAQPPLQSVLLARMADERQQLVWTYHHALLDGWSGARLLQEVLGAYLNEPTPPPSARYRDYIEWLAQRDPEASESYWRAQLEVFRNPTLLAASMTPPAGGEGHARVSKPMTERDTERLKRHAERERLTLNTLVQAAWLLVLRGYTGQSSVAFGATVAGRPAELAGERAPLGLFINTLPVIRKLEAQRPVQEWLAELQRHNLELREHEHTPLYDIQRWAGRGGQALFDTIIVFENYPIARALRSRSAGDLRFGEIESVDGVSHALTVVVSPGDALQFDYRYARRHFDERQVQQLALHVERLLLELVDSSERPLGALSVFPTDPVARAASSSHVASAPTLCLGQWIEEQIDRSPDAIAVSSMGACLSYRTLDERANQLARVLRGFGVGPDVLVGVCLGRSPDMLVGLLAIFKAGGAYLPLDPDYPEQRLRYMLEDSGVELLLTEESMIETLPVTGARRFCLDRDWPEAERQPARRLGNLSCPQHLAYCIYTSGSTGRPKGVLIEQGALVNHMQWMVPEFGLDASARVIQRTALSFDASVWECWLPLLTGGTLVAPQGEASRDPAALLDVIAREGVTVLQLVPQLLEALLREPESHVLAQLSHLFCGGDAFPLDLLQRLLPLQVGVVCNLYGPTEATIDATYWECQSGEGARGTVPIGAAVRGASAWVLSSALEPVPSGVTGELWIGGLGLARGYQGRAALTAERFVPHPLSCTPGERLYRTGDLARYREDGVIEYLGRGDQQVKIRGHRIELGELEAVIREHAAVRDVAVSGRHTSAGDALVAYVVSSADQQQLLQDLRRHLVLSLPEYMLPAQIVVLDELPLTESGKVDRKALPEPTFQASEYVKPTTELGQQLAQIWQEVLAVDRVGVADNFFELGGHSLLAMQVISRIKSVLKIAVPLRCLLEAASLADFERAVEERAYSFASTA
jgi:amino acid adenylation domain-containing protein